MDLKQFIQEEVAKLHKITLLKEEKLKIEKELEMLNETKDITAMYKNAGMEPPHPGKGIHTKKFHKCVTSVGDEGGKNPYAICMSSLGKKKAVHKSHQTEGEVCEICGETIKEGYEGQVGTWSNAPEVSIKVKVINQKEGQDYEVEVLEDKLQYKKGQKMTVDIDEIAFK